MSEQEKRAKVEFITRLVLEELPPNRAAIFMARLHAQLPSSTPETREVLNAVQEVLNAVQEVLHNTAESYLK